jgi:hypothetical protein
LGAIRWSCAREVDFHVATELDQFCTTLEEEGASETDVANAREATLPRLAAGALAWRAKTVRPSGVAKRRKEPLDPARHRDHFRPGSDVLAASPQAASCFDAGIEAAVV